MTAQHTAPKVLRTEGLANPYTAFAAMREEQAVHRVETPDGAEIWFITRYAEARAAMSDPRLSKSPASVGARWAAVAAQPTDGEDMALVRHLLNLDPPDHTRLRKLVLKAFTSRRMEAIRGRIQAITDGLLDDVAAVDGPVDLLAEFAFQLPITVICELLGIPLDERDTFQRWSNTLSTLVADEEGQQRVVVAAKELSEYLRLLVARKEREPDDDLLTAWIEARDDDQRLSQDELTSMAFLLLVGGHETTVHLISNAVLALLTHPGQLAAVRADPGLVPGVIEEVLRWEGSVAAGTWRYALEPIDDYGGDPIPEGAPVLVSLAAADRDPEKYENPDELDVTRDAQGHLAFGHGPHYCIGAALARMEGQIAIGSLLARFTDLRLAVPAEELRWREGLLIRGVHTLPVVAG
ncbi:cytochrome P450 [Lentzea sp. NPDC051213]|uniref:cytochrome P450 n=1 Tax=Lentzea sp. NPDC051213 TaxID=3364126 RepID=UPI0037A04A25